MITGRCECGEVRYQVDAEITDFSHCHCSQCRRLHGAAFASFGGVSRDKFQYLSGQSALRIYASSSTSDRLSCSVCSSQLLVDYKPEPEVLYIAMGTVDGSPDCPTGYHQFVGSKAPWYEINDGLAQHDGWPED